MRYQENAGNAEGLTKSVTACFFFLLQIVLCIENSSTYAHSATNTSVEKCNSESTRFVNVFYDDGCHIALVKICIYTHQL